MYMHPITVGNIDKASTANIKSGVYIILLFSKLLKANTTAGIKLKKNLMTTVLNISLVIKLFFKNISVIAEKNDRYLTLPLSFCRI